MGSSSQQVLRNDIPTFLAGPCASALVRDGSASERWRRRRALLAVILRSYVAVLAPAASPSVLHPLAERDAAALGTWLEVAIALARLAAEDEVVGPVARTLRNERGKQQAGEAALEVLLSQRNDEAHDRVGPSEAEAERFLEGQRDDFVAVLRALEAFRHVRVCALSRPDTSRPGKEHTLWALRGRDPRSLGSVAYRTSPKAEGAFVIGRSGRILPLAPIVGVNWSGSPTALVLDRWQRGAPHYYGSDLRPDHVWHAGGNNDGLVAFLTEHWSPPSADPEIGELAWRSAERRRPALPGFSVHECLGSGSSGAVWKASRSGERCALKVLHDKLLDDAEQRARIHREAEALKALGADAGVCGIREVVESDELGPVLVMEFVDGESLERRVESRSFAQHEAIEVVRKLLSTLEITHAHGLVHRDIKPSNVLMVGSEPVLVDFGLVGGDAFATLTQTTARLGTPQFAAPELMNAREADHRADLFSAARLLGWCVTESTDPTEQAEAFTGRLHGFYRKATDEDVGGRYPDAATMKRELERCLEDVDGPPAAVGRVLAHTYRLDSEEGCVEEGIWCFRATYLASGEPAAVLVARPETADRLEEVVGGTVMAKGTRCPWFALRGEGAVDQAASLFGSTEPFDAAKWWPLAAMAAAPVALGIIGAALGMGNLAKSKKRKAPKVSVPPYLQPFPLKITTRKGAYAIHRVSLVLAAQAHSRGEVRLTSDQWFTLQGKLFMPTSLAHKGGLGTSVQELVGDQGPALLPLFAAKGSLGVKERKLAQAEYMRLLKAAIQLGPASDTDGMAPFVRSSDLGWQFRRRVGDREEWAPLRCPG